MKSQSLCGSRAAGKASIPAIENFLESFGRLIFRGKLQDCAGKRSDHSPQERIPFNFKYNKLPLIIEKKSILLYKINVIKTEFNY